MFAALRRSSSTTFALYFFILFFCVCLTLHSSFTKANVYSWVDGFREKLGPLWWWMKRWRHCVPIISASFLALSTSLSSQPQEWHRRTNSRLHCNIRSGVPQSTLSSHTFAAETFSSALQRWEGLWHNVNKEISAELSSLFFTLPVEVCAWMQLQKDCGNKLNILMAPCCEKNI